MTRNLPETKPDAPAESHGKQRVYAALDQVFDAAVLRRTTGKIILTVDLNEGGVRNIKVGTEELFKTNS